MESLRLKSGMIWKLLVACSALAASINVRMIITHKCKDGRLLCRLVTGCNKVPNHIWTFLLQDDGDHIWVVVSDGHVEGGLHGHTEGVIG